jgi:hypothetical protein
MAGLDDDKGHRDDDRDRDDTAAARLGARIRTGIRPLRPCLPTSVGPARPVPSDDQRTSLFGGPPAGNAVGERPVRLTRLTAR